MLLCDGMHYLLFLEYEKEVPMEGLEPPHPCGY